MSGKKQKLLLQKSNLQSFSLQYVSEKTCVSILLEHPVANQDHHHHRPFQLWILKPKAWTKAKSTEQTEVIANVITSWRF